MQRFRDRPGIIRRGVTIQPPGWTPTRLIGGDQTIDSAECITHPRQGLGPLRPDRQTRRPRRAARVHQAAHAGRSGCGRDRWIDAARDLFGQCAEAVRIAATAAKIVLSVRDRVIDRTKRCEIKTDGVLGVEELDLTVPLKLHCNWRGL